MADHQPEVSGSNGAYAQAFSLFNCGIAGGTMVGPLWMGFAVAYRGWALATLTLGLLALSAIVPVAIFIGSDDGPQGSDSEDYERSEPGREA